MTDGRPTAPTRHCAPGEWYAVLGDRVTVVLPPEARGRVAALWELADEGAGAAALLDAVLAHGLRGLPAMALVEESPGGQDGFRVLLRGSVRALALGPAGQQALDAVGVATWTDQLVTGAGSVAVELDPAAGPADLVVTSGIARVGGVVVGELSTGGGPPVEPAVESAQESAAEPVQESAEPAQESAPGPATETLSTPVPVPEAAAASLDPADAPTGDQPPVDAPADVPHDHDGQTRAGSTPDDFARPQPGIPGQPPAPSVTSRPVARLLFSTGEVIDVDRTVVVGRAPEQRRLASADRPQLVTVASPHQEISSTHLEIRPGSGADHGAAVVTDLGSTNGTVLVQPGLPAEDLRAGIAVALVPGAVLDLGDGVTIQTTNA